ncbi:hypothetical protein D1P53_005910 [Cryptococcus gattii VGV]|nr:hypothetical protein D1P53_005910 [Cryptococcus gattii VGV]
MATLSTGLLESQPNTHSSPNKTTSRASNAQALTPERGQSSKQATASSQTHPQRVQPSVYHPTRQGLEAKRSSTPLPTHMESINPRNTAAAEKLEKGKARPLMHIGVSSGGSTSEAEISGNSEIEGNDAMQIRPSVEQYPAIGLPRSQVLLINSFHVEERSPLHGMLAASKTGLTTVSGDARPSIAATATSREGWDRSLRRSLATASSPPRPAPMVLSSDNLVRREAEEKPSLTDFKRQSHFRTTFERIRHQNNSSKPNRQRKYISFENPLSTFILGGHVLIGGDTWYSMTLVLVLLLGISGVWLGTTGVWMWLHGTEYGLGKGGGIAATIVFVYLFGMTTSSFVVTAFRDPEVSGIIPRKLDPDPPMAQVDEWWEAYPRELTVQNGRRALSDSPGAAGEPTCVKLSTNVKTENRSKLLLFNITTIEQIRANTSKSLFALPKRPDNPFSGPSFVSNVLLASLARPQFPSWINASGWKQEDRRQINPALENWRFGRERA